ncbi:TPA: hypothetical protein N2N45_004316 [Klebsiella aerogenes]|nr:hypothetical protein [Klebsiella aerogenes]
MKEVTVSQEYIEKASLALQKSSFWEFADCPVTIRLAMRQAELDAGRVNKAARSAAKLILKRIRDPQVRKFVLDIATAADVEKCLSNLEAYRDKLISKVAKEFVEVDKAPSIKVYRLKRTQQAAITGYKATKSSLSGSMYR